MNENEAWETELDGDRGHHISTGDVIAGLVARGWRGHWEDLEPVALEALWQEALAYARWEISQYALWRGRDEPVLADGYDAEGVVQAAFARLMSREAGGASVVYTAGSLRHELRSMIKHRVRWLHERKETGLVVGEWDVLPQGPDGELVSVFDNLPSRIVVPDRAVARKEQDRLLGEFKAGFEKTLVKREELGEVFRQVWAGAKRREIAQRLGTGVARTKILQRQVNERLAKFAAQARGAVAEMLKGLGKD